MWCIFHYAIFNQPSKHEIFEQATASLKTHPQQVPLPHLYCRSWCTSWRMSNASFSLLQSSVVFVPDWAIWVQTAETSALNYYFGTNYCNCSCQLGLDIFGDTHWRAVNHSMQQAIFPVAVNQWCSNRGPQGPLKWPVKQFSLERKLNALII